MTSSILPLLTSRLCLVLLLTVVVDGDPVVWPAARVETYSSSSTVVRNTVSPRDLVFDYHIQHDSIRRSNVESRRKVLTMTEAREILDKAEQRFRRSLTRQIPSPRDACDQRLYPFNPQNKELWPLVGMHVKVSSLSPLSYGVDESYAIEVPPVVDNDGYIKISATTVYGILRAYQTLLQLLDFGWIDIGNSTSCCVDEAVFLLTKDAPIQIFDEPEYRYRGLMIDTARHYLPMNLILHNLGAMEMNKLNVLHWHLTDSQSFPYRSDAFPELSRRGAYCEKCIYTKDDIQRVIQEAADRGIRTILEIDLPGHSAAIGASHPEFLCRPDGGRISEPLDVTKTDVLRFVRDLYEEIAGIVEDDWVHIGGDEVSLSCWHNSSRIQSWMKVHNMTKDLELLKYFESHLIGFLVDQLGKHPIVWEELFDLNVTLPPSTLVDCWKDWDLSARQKATASGFNILFSACWYLDHLKEDWESFYACDPRAFNGTELQKSRVMGGHASMWGERVDETNFMARVWPRASAMAEKLWTGNITKAAQTAERRLQSFRCKMLEQGVPASPIAPGSCRRKGLSSMPREQKAIAVNK